ncbi:MAG: Protein TolR [Pseudomonadota bacterium]|jgi:biopolymer transport protein TolR
MGMAVGGNKSGGGNRRRRGGGKSKPMSEINVTPFVDVMLVLLIIFMVAAPLMTVGVPVELPKTSASELTAEKDPITISVNQAGEIFLQETPISFEEVLPKLQAIATTGYDERIFIRADTTSAYGSVMKVMAQISSAGYKNLGLVTLKDDQSK